MRLVLSLLFSFGLTLPALADQPLCAQTKDELDKLAGFSVREKWEETEQHEDDGKPMWLTLKDVDGALTLTLEKKPLIPMSSSSGSARPKSRFVGKAIVM